MNRARGSREDEGFFVLARALGAFKAVQLTGYPSDRSLAEAAGVSPTTVGDWLRGRRFPQQIDGVLKVLDLVRAAAAARGISGEDNGVVGLLDEQKWRTAHWAETRRRADVVSAEVQRSQAVQVPTGSLAGRLLSEVRDPFALEVRRPVQPEISRDDLPVLPEYVPREHDRELDRVVAAAAGGTSGLAVLVGGSSTGKTRACWEALHLLRAQQPEWRLWHPIDPSRPEAALRNLLAIGPRTAVWLNEAQFYLDARGDLGERIAAGLRELLRDAARSPVLVLATIWPSFWDILTSRPTGGTDHHSQARDLLTGRDIPVPVAFTAAQLRGLSEATDARLVQAAKGAEDGQVIQFLAGAPNLLARYRNAPPAASALIQAAMDARRMGIRPALPYAFLEKAAPGYLTDNEWDQLGDDWLEQALAYTTAPGMGIRGPLTRIRPRPDRTVHVSSDRSADPVYRLADYLDQYGRSARQKKTPPAAFWTAGSYADPDDLGVLGNAARDRGLYRDAGRLYKQASSHGDPTAAVSFIHLMHRMFPGDQRAADWAAVHAGLGEPATLADLVDAMRESGATEQITALLARDPAAHIALNDPYGVAKLLKALRQAGATKQITALLARDPASHVPIDDRGVGWIIEELKATGASEQLSAVIARDPASHAPIDDPAMVSFLLGVLMRTGATEQFAILANRAVADPLFEIQFAQSMLLLALAQAGATEQMAILLAQNPAAQASLNEPVSTVFLLAALRAAGATEQIANLLARNPASHVNLQNASGVAWLLDSLRALGAFQQVAALLGRDPVSHASLDDPSGVTWMLNTLRELGASEHVAALLGRDPASHASLDRTSDVAFLLNALQEASAQEQAKTLISRANQAGWFQFVWDHTGQQDKFQFGRENDGSPAARWRWEDLD